VRRGVKRPLVSCDVPAGSDALRAAKRLADEGGAEMVKVLGEPDLVRAIVKAGVAVFAEFHGDGVPRKSWLSRPNGCRTPAHRSSTSDTRARSRAAVARAVSIR